MPLSKRELAEQKIYDFLNTLDPTGYNATKYKDFFKGMSDKAFHEYMKKMADDETENLFYEIDSFGKNGYPNMEQIVGIAKKYKVKLTERVFFPHKNPGDPELPGSTATEVPIIMVPIRRLQQMADKKNSAAGDNNVVNPIIGQVTGDSKSASLSDMQTCALASTNQTATIKEFLGPRADDQETKITMLEQIEKYGATKLADLTMETKNKQSIETMRVFLMGAGIEASM